MRNLTYFNTSNVTIQRQIFTCFTYPRMHFNTSNVTIQHAGEIADIDALMEFQYI